MGTTGSSDKVAMNKALPDIIARVRQYATVPIAVGFGVANRSHFKTVTDAGADGVVIGSKLVSIIKNAPQSEAAKNVEDFCRTISSDDPELAQPSLLPISTHSNTGMDAPPAVDNLCGSNCLPARFGQFGGQYVPEALVDCLAELEEAHKSAMADPEFQKELRSYFGYMNRPSQIYLAENLTRDADGANIWLKREDLCVFSCLISFRNNFCVIGIILGLTRSTTQSDRYFPHLFSSAKVFIVISDSTCQAYRKDTYNCGNGCRTAWCCNCHRLC